MASGSEGSDSTARGAGPSRVRAVSTFSSLQVPSVRDGPSELGCAGVDCSLAHLIDEVLAFALPPPGTIAPERPVRLGMLARQASQTWRSLAMTSRAWARVAAPLWRTLLVSGERESARLASALALEVRIVVSSEEIGRGIVQGRKSAVAALRACRNARMLVVPDVDVVDAMAQPLAQCSTLIAIEQGKPISSSVFRMLPALRRFGVSSTLQPRSGILIPGVDSVTELILRSPAQPKAIAAFRSLVRLQVDGRTHAIIREISMATPATLQHLIIDGWDGFAWPRWVVNELEHGFGLMLAKLSSITVIAHLEDPEYALRRLASTLDQIGCRQPQLRCKLIVRNYGDDRDGVVGNSCGEDWPAARACDSQLAASVYKFGGSYLTRKSVRPGAAAVLDATGSCSCCPAHRRSAHHPSSPASRPRRAHGGDLHGTRAASRGRRSSSRAGAHASRIGGAADRQRRFAARRRGGRGGRAALRAPAAPEDRVVAVWGQGVAV